jgi:penicillin-binding protein 1B
MQLPQYSDTRQFAAPEGVSTVRLDKATNLIADDACPVDYDAIFLDGTAPTQTCDQGAGDQRNLFQKIFGIGSQATVTPGLPVNGQPALPAPQAGTQQTAISPPPSAIAPAADQQQKKKKGFFGRLFGSKSDNDNKPPPQPDPSQPH